MFLFEDAQGLLFYREEQIAAITPEFRGRYRIVAADGTCGTRPSPPPEGPWAGLGPSLVAPPFLKASPGGFLDPRGFFHAGELTGQWSPQDLSDWDGDLDCDPDEVQQLVGVGENGLGCVWITDVGEFPWDKSASSAAREHPTLVQLRRGHYLNLRRFRKIVRGRDTSELILDTGDRFEFYNTKTSRLLAKRLGLPHLRFLEPRNPGLYRYDLHDWPFPIATASSKVLRQHFQDARVLIANLVWQVVRYRQLGLPTHFGKEYRDFWYDPVVTTLYRAGFLSRARYRALKRGESKDELFTLFQEIVGQMVGDDHLFNFSELGFEDPTAELRHLGDRFPHIVIVAEKRGLKGDLQRLAAEFGVGYVILGGSPSLVSSEFFARAFAHVGPLLLIAYVDYDVGGALIAETFVKQMVRFQKSVERMIHLITPECFSAEEIELYALPCPSSTASLRTKAANWVKNGGGIQGKPLGIHANHLKPFERVRQRFLQLTEGLLQKG